MYRTNLNLKSLFSKLSARRRQLSRATPGFSILEFAMTLPVLLATTLAALDISSVLQARSALQQATTTALRCVYPVDGACVTTNPDSRQRFYQYYALPPSTNDSYIVPRVDFSGTASFFHAPIRELAGFQGRFLQDVYFDIPKGTYRVRGPLNAGYRVRQNFQILENLQVVPNLQGSGPRLPTFVFANSGGTYPVAPTASSAARLPGDMPGFQSGVILTGNGGSVNLAAGHPTDDWSTIYRFTVTAPASPGYCAGEHCGYLTSETTRVAFQLEGFGYSSIAGGCASVGLRLSSQVQVPDPHRPGHTRIQTDHEPLGGQHFEIHDPLQVGRSVSLNFYPRGIPQSHAPASWGEVREFQSYGQLEVAYGREYALQISMNRSDGENCNSQAAMNWHSSDVSFYLPKYDVQSEGLIDCLNGSSVNPLPADYRCARPADDAVPAAALVGSPILDPSATIQANVDQEVSGAVSLTHAQALAAEAALASSVAPEDQVRALSVEFLRSDPPLSASHACGQNAGVPEPLNQEPLGSVPSSAIRNSSAALSVCPPNLSATPELTELLPYQPSIANVRWSETAPRAIAHDPVRWTKRDCLVSAPGYVDLPAELQVYPREKLTWNERLATEAPFREVIATGAELEGNPADDPHDPVVLKARDPRFQCPELTLASVTYDDSNRALHTPSLFIGVHDNQSACNLGHILRAAAEASNVPASIRLRSDIFFRPGVPTNQDRVELHEAPIDPCVGFSVKAGQVEGLGELVAGGPFAEGQVPAACQENGSCRRIFDHFAGVSSSGVTYRTQAAEQLGREELFAAAPWTANLCGSATCGNVAVSEDSPSAGMLTATASTKVRLSTLFGSEITLSHTHHERYEGEQLR